MVGGVHWLIGVVLASGPGAVRYDGQSVVRVWPADAAQLEHALALARDVWSEGTPRPGRPLDIVVGPGDVAALEVGVLAYETLIDDLQGVVDVERDRLAALEAPAEPRVDWFADFRDLPTIEAYLDHLAAKHPSLTTLVEVGESLEGRPIRALEIRGSGEGPTPALLLTGTQHAREWISPMVGACIATRLLDGYASEPDIQSLVDRVDFLVVPVLNPDGYAYSWSTDRFWRKNRRDETGVDLNRNWGAGFGAVPGSSSDPEQQDYRGVAAFSEPETAAVRDYVLAHPEIAGHVDLHSYSQLVLFPYSYTEQAPPMVDDLRGWAFGLAQALESVHGVPYVPLAGPDFYFAAGTAPDWTLSELSAFSFTVELRPTDADEFESGFVLPPEQIAGTCDEALFATRELARWLVEGGPAPLPEPEDDGGGSESGDDEGPSPDLGGEAGETGSGDSRGADASSDAAACGCVDGRASPIGALAPLLLPLFRRRRTISTP